LVSAFVYDLHDFVYILSQLVNLWLEYPIST